MVEGQADLLAFAGCQVPAVDHGLDRVHDRQGDDGAYQRREVAERLGGGTNSNRGEPEARPGEHAEHGRSVRVAQQGSPAGQQHHAGQAQQGRQPTRGRSVSSSSTAENTATCTTSVFEYTVPTAKPRASNALINKMVATIWAKPPPAISGQNRAGGIGNRRPLRAIPPTAAKAIGAPHT